MKLLVAVGLNKDLTLDPRLHNHFDFFFIFPCLSFNSSVPALSNNLRSDIIEI